MMKNLMIVVAGAVLAFGAFAAGELPEGYTSLSSIRSDGAQFIDLQFRWEWRTRAECDSTPAITLGDDSILSKFLDGITAEVRSLKFYDVHEDCVCDMVPCVENASGDFGLYDRARKSFHPLVRPAEEPSIGIVEDHETLNGFTVAPGQVLKHNHRYHVTEDTTIDAAAMPGLSAIRVPVGAAAIVDISPGVTLTLRGGPGYGRIPGGAGIEVPRGSKLVVTGGGTLDVTGDLVVTNAARFDVYAAATNGVAEHGAVVRVGGTLAVGTDGVVYPFTDPTNGGAPVFEASRVDVNLGGTFGVVGGGFSGCKGETGCGPGAGRGDVTSKSSYGAGHGGLGGGVATVTDETVKTNTTAYGRVYDDALRPTLAGSGGGNGWTGMNGGGCGGCVVHLRATEAIAVGGLITANGTTPGGHANGSAAGSGGSVLLEAKSVTFGPAAKVTADGGASAGGSNPSSGGAGGRISVWTGANLWEPGWRKSRYSAADVVPTDWTDVFSVAGGAKNTSGAGGAGEPGTIRFVTTFPPLGMLMIVR